AESVRIMKYQDIPVSHSSISSAMSARFGPPDRKPQHQRMVIRTAVISTEVDRYDSAVALLQRAVTGREGFIVSTTTSSEEKGKKNGTIVLRVPADRFEPVMEDIVHLSAKVLNRSVSGNDVTEEFYDVSARLENKQKIEARYREILRSAKTVEDILSVERYLGEVREEIERLEGRRGFLNDQAQLSTVTVTLREPLAMPENGEEGFWQKVSKGFIHGIYGFGDVLSYSLTFIIASIPAVLLLAGLVVLVLRSARMLRSRSRSVE
ncbi:MAG: DUF4349 domain-containing protein, partial [Bacteroidota bacterium]